MQWWRHQRWPEKAAAIMTPICKNGYLYGISDGRSGSELVCLDWKTGQTMWRTVPEGEETAERNGKQEKMPFTPRRGALLSIDGPFLMLGEYGHLLLVDLSPQGYRELRRAWLFNSGEIWAVPVVSRGLLYVVQRRPDPATDMRPRFLCYDVSDGSG